MKDSVGSLVWREKQPRTMLSSIQFPNSEVLTFKSLIVQCWATVAEASVCQCITWGRIHKINIAVMEAAWACDPRMMVIGTENGSSLFTLSIFFPKIDGDRDASPSCSWHPSLISSRLSSSWHLSLISSPQHFWGILKNCRKMPTCILERLKENCACDICIWMMQLKSDDRI